MVLRTPASASNGGSIHQNQLPAKVAIAFSVIFSESSPVIVNSGCINRYNIVLASCFRRFFFVCLKNKGLAIAAKSFVRRGRSIFKYMAVVAITDRTMVFDARAK